MNVCSRLQTRRLKHLAIGSILATAALGVPFASVAQSVPGRWLQVQRMAGSVTLLTGSRKPAQVGNRLSTVGHGLVTGNRSSAHLSVDDGIGAIAVSQNTRIAIRQLSVLPDGSKVTVIDVPQGQARLQVRRFTHNNSRLELHTPSGVAAVRGTEFGVSVEQNGQTNVATLEGQVEASAQSVVVPVDAGMVSIIHPGDPPTPARVLDRELKIQWLSYEWKNDQFYISGRIDAANTLLAMGEELPVGRTGHFEENLQLTDRSQPVVLTVQNALGEARTYKILPWLSHD
ncbi:FecR domain-containing protein [Leptolyngbya cf. ectocarpi LEGE 11479]|uniref:FecR domain-containing protein n=1 Tax=Leptolyngbya cf. ectocarpi LEGE 11479 TaxID=1828722 RepID=A0A928ZQY9_LEPEC|nr:FecR family protein [Leptolyngbya ectocarpi]MBE9066760.1 FecR domain-containing protein [Leptolyngbya cf. ectocarpi LEGE 11479]